MLTRTPFDDLLDLVEQMPTADETCQNVIAANFSGYKPLLKNNFSGALAWMAAWQGRSDPSTRESHICIFVSSYDSGHTLDAAIGYADLAGRGDTMLNKLCKDKGVGLRVLELAPSMPHRLGSWSEKECMAACAFGMEATAAGGDLLGLSSVAPGSNEVAQQLLNILKEEKPKSGLNDDQRFEKKQLLDALLAQGGREVAALVGAIVAARSRRLPVIVEGWSALAAVFLLWRLDVTSVEHVLFASISDAEQNEFLDQMGQSPLIALNNEFGAGEGVALAISALSPLTSLI